MFRNAIVRSHQLTAKIPKYLQSTNTTCRLLQSKSASSSSSSSISKELESEPSSVKAAFRQNLEELRQRALLGGGSQKIAKQHARGSLTARERLDLLFDAGSFAEVDQMKVHRCQEFGMDKEENKIPGDGVVTGHVSSMSSQCQ
jgi:acetyl-CoA carboxylase beta subunit